MRAWRRPAFEGLRFFRWPATDSRFKIPDFRNPEYEIRNSILRTPKHAAPASQMRCPAPHATLPQTTPGKGFCHDFSFISLGTPEGCLEITDRYPARGEGQRGGGAGASSKAPVHTESSLLHFGSVVKTNRRLGGGGAASPANAAAGLFPAQAAEQLGLGLRRRAHRARGLAEQVDGKRGFAQLFKALPATPRDVLLNRGGVFRLERAEQIQFVDIV